MRVMYSVFGVWCWNSKVPDPVSPFIVWQKSLKSCLTYASFTRYNCLLIDKLDWLSVWQLDKRYVQLWFQLSDVLDYVKTGVAAIIEDEVKQNLIIPRKGGVTIFNTNGTFSYHFTSPTKCSISIQRNHKESYLLQNLIQLWCFWWNKKHTNWWFSTSKNIYLFGGQVTQRFVAEDLKSWNLMTRSAGLVFHSFSSPICNVLVNPLPCSQSISNVKSHSLF